MYKFKDYWKKSTVRFRKRVKIKKGSLDIAPLIDVVFLLLIFFMLTSSFISQPGIPVNLPKALTGKLLKEKRVILTITKDNVYYLDNNLVEKSKLKDELKKVAEKDQSICIRGDEAVTLGRLAEVWDLCRETGISKTNIAIAPKK